MKETKKLTYINVLNAFRAWQRDKCCRISAGASALFYELVGIWNEQGRSQEPMQVAGKELACVLSHSL